MGNNSAMCVPVPLTGSPPGPRAIVPSSGRSLLAARAVPNSLRAISYAGWVGLRVRHAANRPGVSGLRRAACAAIVASSNQPRAVGSRACCGSILMPCCAASRSARSNCNRLVLRAVSLSASCSALASARTASSGRPVASATRCRSRKYCCAKSPLPCGSGISLMACQARVAAPFSKSSSAPNNLRWLASWPVRAGSASSTRSASTALPLANHSCAARSDSGGASTTLFSAASASNSRAAAA